MQETPSVRASVLDAFHRLATTTGSVQEDELLAALHADHGVALGAAALARIASHTAELVRLPGNIYASIGPASMSPLTRCLRRLMAVCPGGLPVDIVGAQLARRHARYAHLSVDALLVLAETHPDLELANGRIHPVQGSQVPLVTELGTEERRIHEALRDAAQPLPPEEIARYIRRHARISPVKQALVLRESVVLVGPHEGRFQALLPSNRLYTSIRGLRAIE